MYIYAYAKAGVYVHIGEIKIRRVICNLIKALTHTTVIYIFITCKYIIN